MAKAGWMIAGVLALVAGAVGLREFLSSPEAPPVAPRKAPAAAPADPAGMARLEADVAALRGELQTMSRMVEGLRQTEQKLLPILEMAGGAERSAYAPAAPVRIPDAVRPADGVAELLGLDSGRRLAFEQSYDALLQKLRALESSRAKATRDGKAVVITIPALETEGKSLAREWSSQIDTLLTPQERERYRKYSMEQSLFPLGLQNLSGSERTITITGGGNQYTVSESGTRGPEGSFTRSMTGSETILAPYRHLLDR